MSNLVKIADHNGLLKDLSTGAIINADADAYRSALARKKNAKIIEMLQQRCDELDERVKKLEELYSQHK